MTIYFSDDIEFEAERLDKFFDLNSKQINLNITTTSLVPIDEIVALMNTNNNSFNFKAGNEDLIEYKMISASQSFNAQNNKNTTVMNFMKKF